MEEEFEYIDDWSYIAGFKAGWAAYRIIALSEIHKLGGCDAKDEWSKGYDDGVSTAFDACVAIRFPEAADEES